MFVLYDLLVRLISGVLKITAGFSPKMKLFVNGRSKVFETLSQKIAPGDPTFWFHSASLGEYEQGLPVMEKIKSKFPNHKIVLTFFSPSGYEVRKHNTVADVTVYLPMDTQANAKRFLDLIHPEKAFFIKYEFWPNYLSELKKRHIATFLISGIFREGQVFFKWYGGFYRKGLDAFSHFFVQNSKAKALLQGIGKQNVTVSGDTRFDRVVGILERDHTLDFVSDFKGDKTLVVAGSTWPKDDEHLIPFLNRNIEAKFILVPHDIKTEHIENLRKNIHSKVVLFSEKDGKNLADYDVLIVDTVGILTKIYRYADIAYVGGGFGTAGLHNILEPAAFGVPVLIGPHYARFAEAVALVNMGGCLSAADAKSFDEMLEALIRNKDERAEKGHIAATFVQMNKGATAKILNHLS